MKAAEFSAALGDVKDAYIQEALTYKPKKTIYFVRAAVAACLCIAILGGLFAHFYPAEEKVFSFDKVLTKGFVEGVQPTGDMMAWGVPVGDRVATYRRAWYRPGTFELDEEKLADYVGEEYCTTEFYTMYYPLGWDTLGWLIGYWPEEDQYILFYFLYFDVPYGETYTYGEVLEKVYGVTSAEDIVSIDTSPVQHNNAELGHQIQKEVGNNTYSNKEDMATFYDIVKDVVWLGNSLNDVEPYNHADECYYKVFDWNRFHQYSFSTDNMGEEFDYISTEKNRCHMAKLTTGETTYGSRLLKINLANGSFIKEWEYCALTGAFTEIYFGATMPMDENDVTALNAIFGIK